jgi:hypothetical protein
MTHVRMSRRATLTLAIVGATGFAPRVVLADAEDQAKGESLPATTPTLRDLKMIGPEGQITEIVGKTFEIQTADGRRTSFSETSLRFKIDSSEFGPPTGRPVILSGGMIGDRATVFFALATEIGMLMKRRG